MDQGRASTMAMQSALQRAAHQWFDDEPKVLTDPVAERFLDSGARESYLALEERSGRAHVASVRVLLVLRNRFAEDELESAAARGVEQYVMLGAGLDTFAFRQPPFAAHLRLFDVDHPATQAWKRARLAAAGLADPPNLRWAPVDFERDALADGLAAAGFDATRPACFSWLGVMMYLTWPAIDAVLGFVAALPRPSTIVLDFVPPDEALTGFDLKAMQRLAAAIASVGEPLRTRPWPEVLAARLRAAGFSRVSLLTPEEANARYFAGRRDGLRVPGYAPLVSATV
ncbi:MAG TPA: SAM-dependent methyltransferase [Thermomicrobiales bacterium]|nr:SAM-dependent methyltransferase [Thermomicrobiales bacterium]